MNNRNCQSDGCRPPVASPYTRQFACNQELAMAYVPWQQFEHLYEPDQALRNGTVFQDLNKPFYGSCSRKGGRSL